MAFVVQLGSLACSSGPPYCQTIVGLMNTAVYQSAMMLWLKTIPWILSQFQGVRSLGMV